MSPPLFFPCRFHFALVALLVSSLSGTAGRAAPATDGLTAVLQAVPDNAWAVVFLNRLDRVDSQVAKVTGLLRLPAPGPLGMARQVLGVREGLDDTRSAAI